MSESGKQPRKLEDILQQWGAQEALDEARTLHLRLPRLQRLPFGHPMLAKLRWWAVAGSIIMAIGIAAMVIWWAMHWQRVSSTSQPASAPSSQIVPMDDSLLPAATQPADDDTKVRQLQEKMRSLVKELSQIRKLQDDSLKASQQAQAELAALKAQQDLIFGDLQMAVLNAFSKDACEDGDLSLVARQSAGRGLRLLQRVPSVRASAKAPACRQLIDRLDVVLTQLDMVEADKADCVKSVKLLLGGGEIMRLIDVSSKQADESPAVRAWLLEVKIILAGVDNV